ncbi:MAG: TIGR00730 family Rossman fold protein [Ignavibacteriaceae bacterium]|nr:MAG: TIGR00730 family Rossman fold protein [Chlorobiota bacterium]KXK01767.1 MAG: Rossmann fold nucleotide-binding protein [Chlorobi bacterium OLB4]MBV6399017.1 Cytokinin riboside 5'-monophosphate phosphoribohydrolase [Ignavibacteria bacterium]MCC6885954.1 TIGR00730 family Rossman fold protein [Ignavibacteriales bacterium]MCE7953389.1 TIGR00730 family Rossman fold protein [Chlorobi bacterium CHB7]MDL1887325.1 TIGR00730 family Rossman fold protein [Ignavibacteria bacterium CHB1]MEB2330621.1
MNKTKNKNLCVFCGSKNGRDISYSVFSQKVGKELAKRNIGLVYGGGNIGLMGDISNEVLKYNGKVTGVIPEFMRDKELANNGITELIVVNTMHDRKFKMTELSDGFIVLPGGIGTMDEFFEIWTWTQLGLISKPIGIMNYKGFYDPLKEFIDKLNSEGFLSERTLELVSWGDKIEILLDEMGF